MCVDGILAQTTRTIKALIGLATEGAPAEEIEVAFRALRDQWTAAEREAAHAPAGSAARFDAEAAALLGDAYQPVLNGLCAGRSPRSSDVDLAHRVAAWLNLAYRSLLEGDHEGVERCMAAAAAFVAIQSRHRPAE